MKRAFTAGAALILAALGLAGAARAQNAVADFYRGKQIQLRIGSAPGSGYDLAGRIVAPYLGKYIPGNPTIVVQNVPGAGSLTLANQLYNTAPKDGTVIGVVTNGMPTAPMLTPETARFDVSHFGWIGAQAAETQIVTVSEKSPVQTLDDLFKKELLVGAVSLGTATVDVPLVTNDAAGTKFKLVMGYESLGNIDLAMERGEVFGNAGAGWVSVKARNQKQLKDGTMRIIVQYGFKKHPDLQDIPLFPMPANEADRQAIVLMFARQEYGRPFLAPPGVPADRLAALRQAFQAVMKDPDFIKDAARADSEINPVTGEELDKLTAQIVKTDPAVIERVRKLLDPDSIKK